ncbi:nuclear transport factor 2 family protein [Trinickia sp. NRRL B-1857]|uniref:nuclear transport factor 2 family protein n=1 Tax=Trinickia sp. NRRL B-1857 TaxID=3162879 RepID=UPI003D2B62DE
MDSKAIIFEHEQALRRAMLDNDVAVLTRLLDDELVFTGPDGQVLSKKDDLSAHRDKRLRLDRLDLYDTEIHAIGALIWVTTKAKLAGSYASSPFDGDFAYSRLWRESGAGWQIVAGQAAKIG